MTAAAVEMEGIGLLWRVCRVGYQCVEGTLRSGGGSTLGSDGVLTLRMGEGSF